MEKMKFIYCPKCTMQLEVPKSYLGQKGECPYCGEKFIMKLPKKEMPDLVKCVIHAIYLILMVAVLSAAGNYAKKLARTHFNLSGGKNEFSERNAKFSKELNVYNRVVKKYTNAISTNGLFSIINDKSYDLIFARKDVEKTRATLLSTEKEAVIVSVYCRMSRERYNPKLTNKVEIDCYNKFTNLLYSTECLVNAVCGYCTLAIDINKMMNGFVNKGNRNDVEFADKKLDDLISAAKSRDKTSPVSKEAVFEHYIKCVSEKLDEKCDEYARCAARHKKICNEISELK